MVVVQAMKFTDAMEILYGSCTSDKRKLNKILRDSSLKNLDVSMSVEEASYFVESYSDIRETCCKIAVDYFNADSKPNFDDLVFSKYPEISNELKSKWIKGAYFSVFR